MRKLFGGFAAAVALAVVPVASSASVLLGYIASENDCAGVFGNPPNCTAYYPLDWTPESGKDPLLKPTPLIGKIDYESTGTKWTAGVFGSITGSEFDVTLNADGSGSFTYTPGAGDPVLTAFVVKDGNGFWLFEADLGGLAGSWTKDQQQGGEGISHISFYDGGGIPPSEVPEPGTALLAGLALLGLAASRRRGKI
jgi:hypothetical protein